MGKVHLNKNKNFALGHQRLSIYDTSERANQPFHYLNRYNFLMDPSIIF